MTRDNPNPAADDYTPRELRIMAERDAALTAAETAEEALLKVEARCQVLETALREACDVAGQGWRLAYGAGENPDYDGYHPHLVDIVRWRKLADP